MISDRKILSLVLWLSLLISGACTLATPTSAPPTEKPDSAYTAAAQTIIAQLTEVSFTPTPSPQAGAAINGTKPGGRTQTPLEPSPTPESSQTPAPSETPTLTPTITNTPLPTATTVAGDPKLSLGEPDFHDAFENTANWPVYEDEHVTMDLKDNSLIMTALKADKWDSWMLSWNILRDFYLEVTAEPGKCSGRDHYGLLARAPSPEEAYLFGFTCDGQYSLRRWTGERFIYIVDWTPSEFILKGSNQVNRLGLKADGNHLSLYANGKLLDEVTDANYRKGGFGIFLGANETPNFEVRFIEVNYWELP